MEPGDELGTFLKRVMRDMDAPMAMIVASDAQQRVLAHRGFEGPAVIRSLVSVDRSHTRLSDGSTDHVAVGWRSCAQAPIVLDEEDVGSLVVADRRRRWFDDDEVRHLSLMTAVVGPVLVLRRSELLDLDTVDVREPAKAARLTRLG